MRLSLSLLQILFLARVSSIKHYWVILSEPRRIFSINPRCKESASG